MASPLPWLTEELIEEILLRLPPEEPGSLVRAAFVCKPWRRLVCDPYFRRRFREFHRTPPMLGFLCNHRDNRRCTVVRSSSSSSSSFPLHAARSPWLPLDARHGRVLLRDPTRNALAVWDPITDVRQQLPVLPRWAFSCTAAVLCAAGGAGVCDGHHDCHLGSFLVVFVGTDPRNLFVCTYDSADYFAKWSDPISVYHPNDCYMFAGYLPAVLLGNMLYLGIARTNTALQYDLELREISWIQLPTMHYWYQRCVLTTMEDGLGVISVLEGKLCMWLRMDATPKANAGWTQIKAIDLGMMGFHVNPVCLKEDFVVGFADGLDIVFVIVNGDMLFTVDLKTNMVKKVYNGTEIYAVFPYMRFHSPALEAAYLGDEEQCSWILGDEEQCSWI